MATTVSGLTEAKLKNAVIPALRNVLPLFNAFSFRAEEGMHIQDDVVYVDIATDPTAQSKTAGTAVTPNGTNAGSSVTLSNFYAAGWDYNEGKISSQHLSQAWADKAAGAVYSLAVQVIDAALGLITAANYGNTAADKLAVSYADFGQGDIANLWKLATDKIKNREKVMLLNTGYAAQVFDSVALTFATAGNNVLGTGSLPSLLGMNTMHYAGMPANSQNLGGAVIGKSAILAAVAPPEALFGAGDGDVMDSYLITEPDSGLTVLYRSTCGYGGNISGECSLLYGVAKGQDAVVRLVTA